MHHLDIVTVLPPHPATLLDFSHFYRRDGQLDGSASGRRSGAPPPDRNRCGRFVGGNKIIRCERAHKVHTHSTAAGVTPSHNANGGATLPRSNIRFVDRKLISYHVRSWSHTITMSRKTMMSVTSEQCSEVPGRAHCIRTYTRARTHTLGRSGCATQRPCSEA